MTSRKRDEPPAKVAAGKPASKAERAQRLAAALRANLKRRKAQARGRATTDTDAGDSPHKTRS